MVWQLVLQLILIALNAVFACAEIATISMNDTKLEKLAASGNKKAITLKKLTSQPAQFLATIQVAITLSGFIGAAFAADNFADSLTALILKTGISVSANVLRPISVVVITLLLSYLTLVFGELVPKRVGMKYAETLSLNMAGMIRFVQIVFAPLVWLLNISTNAILRLFGIDPNKEDEAVTEEEIMMMSDAGAEKGTINAGENQIIKNVFAFDDLTAETICTHRTDASVLWEKDDLSVWRSTLEKEPHSYYPVCGERIDEIKGVLSARDFYRINSNDRKTVFKKAVHTPFFVPESAKADKIFESMRKRGASHFAVVVDEYGGMAGVLSITDLLEELVGDFNGSDDEAVLTKTGDNTWTIPGLTALTDVCAALNITLPTDEYDTFSGYVIGKLGAIPENDAKTELDCDGLHIELQQVRNHRIELCKVSKQAAQNKASSKQS